jgi:CDP-glycerol glycerophosphotransferase (TagB/SpsB family)
VFGNAVQDLESLHSVSKTVLMQHGIGPKSCYYDVSENPTTVRFVEGQHRLQRLQGLYPSATFIDSGYAKLDPAIHQTGLKLDITKLGLDPSKPTLLYAPTFYPSSIEMMSESLASDFADFNIIIKPHYFSLTKAKYQKQRALLEHFAKSDNVYLAKVEDYNLIPLMSVSDIMLSDASSAIFEFAALGKPVVWCDFYKLRWSYRGIFKFRFTNRLDSDIDYFSQVAIRAKSYQELKAAVAKAPTHHFSEREAIIEQLAGSIDGYSAKRITQYLLEH